MLQEFVAKVLTKISKRDQPVKKELARAGSTKQRERKEGLDAETLRSYWRTSPVIGPAIDDMAIAICGAGFMVAFRNKDGFMALSELPGPVAVLKASRHIWATSRVIHDAYKVGNGYLLKQRVGDTIVKLVPIPPDNVEPARDMYMNVTEYVQNVGQEDENPKWVADDVIHIKVLEETGEAYGISPTERVAEDDDILRNMKLDLGEIMENVAYPPKVYRCGTPTKPWGKDKITAFLSSLGDTAIGKIIGVNGDVEVVKDEIQVPDISPAASIFASGELNGIGVPACQTGIVDTSDGNGDKQTIAYMKRVAHRRLILKEQLEVELLDPLLESWGHTDVTAELIWLPLPGEDERMTVNNTVALIQNSLVTRDYAQFLLGFPIGDDMPGEYTQAVDHAEGEDPTIHAEADQNTKEDVEANDGDDGRTK